jgi:hypothetical protein
MDEPAQRPGESAGNALGVAALALGVEDGVRQPPDAVGDETQREGSEHQPAGFVGDIVEGPARILRPPQPERQIADDQIEQPAGGEPDSGEQQEVGGYAWHGAVTCAGRRVFQNGSPRREHNSVSDTEFQGGAAGPGNSNDLEIGV